MDNSISVIITCYNQGMYLAEAIKSVLLQQHQADEIIIIDDGSSDNTSKVAAGFQETKYITQQNRGLASARNLGLVNSNGDYIIFLDADDRLLPNALKAGLKCFELKPESAFVAGHFRYINEDGSYRSEYPQVLIYKDYYAAFLRGNVIGMHAVVMYRRNILKETGGFNTELSACEDYDLYLRIVREFPIAFHNDIIAEYRQHNRNMSGNFLLMLNASLRVLNSQKDFIKTRELRKAFRAGKRSWITFYGSPLLRQSMHLLRKGEFLKAERAVGTLLRHSPEFIF